MVVILIQIVCLKYAKLRKILGVFSNVTDLNLSIWLPRHAKLLEPPAEGPAVVPLLDTLQVHFERQVHFDLDAKGALHVLAVKLESATKLKSLGIYDFVGVLRPHSMEDLALAVGNCRVLQNLNIYFSDISDDDDIFSRGPSRSYTCGAPGHESAFALHNTC
eukprot:jgi/Botrbrau1/18293/Bobra.0179s0024.1